MVVYISIVEFGLTYNNPLPEQGTYTFLCRFIYIWNNEKEKIKIVCLCVVVVCYARKVIFGAGPPKLNYWSHTALKRGRIRYDIYIHCGGYIYIVTGVSFSFKDDKKSTLWKLKRRHRAFDNFSCGFVCCCFSVVSALCASTTTFALAAILE
jgi:hypothetical protein